MNVKWYILFLFLIASIGNAHAHALEDTTQLKSIYDRCLDFNESNLDSMIWYANHIDTRAKELSFRSGKVLSDRLRGIHADLSENYEEAASWFLASLEEARRLKVQEYESAALSDLAILYSRIKQPDKALKMYLQCLDIAIEKNELVGLITTYTNLGGIYSSLKMHSDAILCLRKALQLSGTLEGKYDLGTLYNNLGNEHFKSRNLDSALYYFRLNQHEHEKTNDASSQWLDYLNLADVFIEKEKFDSAKFYADKSLKLANKIGATSKRADSYAVFAKLYERKNDYASAYTYIKQWHSLDTSLVNLQTNQRIADLQEKYNSQKRESENRLLAADLKTNKLQRNWFIILAFALLTIALLTATALVSKRKANQKLDAINKITIEQNKKLAELNQEKNSLISIVSHDLSAPFVNIMMWGQLLQTDAQNLTSEQKTALDRMIQSSVKGENLIRTILDVEKSEISSNLLELKHTDIYQSLVQISTQFAARAKKKCIEVILSSEGSNFTVMTDPSMVERILDNLISNAIKFSPAGSKVWLHIQEQANGEQVVVVRDEGIGIPADEIHLIFSKYSNISSAPTDGENSNGLGLSIVKRLVDELNGEIICKSEAGIGTSFSVTFR